MHRRYESARTTTSRRATSVSLGARRTRLHVALSRRAVPPRAGGTGDAPCGGCGPRNASPNARALHVGHVFLTRSHVTVVDLDRAAVADPAKERRRVPPCPALGGDKRRWPSDAVAHACDAFLHEYARGRPGAVTELTYYWSYSILWAMLGLPARRRPGRTAWSARSEFLRARRVRRRSAPGGGLAPARWLSTHSSGFV